MLLQAIELDAKAQKLDPQFAKAFFTAQFAAAKKYQQEIQATLPKAKSDEATMKAAELQMTDARKKISEINEQMLKVLVKLNWETNAATIRPKLSTLAPNKLAPYSEAIRKLALEPLMK
jgi:chorismate mutase